MLRKLILSTAVAGVASALGGATPGLAQDAGVFGEGPDRICNVVRDSAGSPVFKTGTEGPVRQNATFDCPEEEMMAAVEPAAAPPLPDNGEVYFQLDKSDLTPEAQQAINDMIFDIKDRELGGIKVVGHTDTSCPPGGSTVCQDYNQTLSEKRAETVAQALIAQNVPIRLITTEGVGMNDLQVQTGPNTVLEANRRAVIEFE